MSLEPADKVLELEHFLPYRRLDPDDRRRSSLRLSAEGERIYRQIVPAAQAFEQGLVAPLTADEQASLDHLLTRLTGHTDDGSH